MVSASLRFVLPGLSWTHAAILTFEVRGGHRPFALTQCDSAFPSQVSNLLSLNLALDQGLDFLKASEFLLVVVIR